MRHLKRNRDFIPFLNARNMNKRLEKTGMRLMEKAVTMGKTDGDQGFISVTKAWWSITDLARSQSGKKV